MDFNYHTHTTRCHHAQGEDREYVEAAIRKGLKTLGFSDHAPYLFKDEKFWSAHRMETDLLHDYAESVRSLQKEYAKDIRILLGFELEYYPDLHKDEMAFLKSVKPDYIIMGPRQRNRPTVQRRTARRQIPRAIRFAGFRRACHRGFPLSCSPRPCGIYLFRRADNFGIPPSLRRCKTNGYPLGNQPARYSHA